MISVRSTRAIRTARIGDSAAVSSQEGVGRINFRGRRLDTAGESGQTRLNIKAAKLKVNRGARAQIVIDRWTIAGAYWLSRSTYERQYLSQGPRIQPVQTMRGPKGGHRDVIQPTVDAQHGAVLAIPARHIERPHAELAHVAQRHRLDLVPDAARHRREPAIALRPASVMCIHSTVFSRPPA
jgi:hypothetical protein